MATLPLTFYHTWKPLDSEARYRAMCAFAAGGGGIVVNTFLLKLLCSDYSYTLVDELRRQAERAGVKFIDAHAPFHAYGDLFTPVERQRKLTVARQKLHLAFVRDLGVDTCTFHVGSDPTAGYTLEQHREAFYRSLDELLPAAEEMGITICIENLFRPLSSADDLLGYLDRYDSPRLALCLDVGHANLKEVGRKFPDSQVVEAWRAVGLEVPWEEHIAERMLPYIATCHIHDNCGFHDDHDLPGRGIVDWKRIVPLLLAAPKLRCIHFEVEAVKYGISISELCRVAGELFGSEADKAL